MSEEQQQHPLFQIISEGDDVDAFKQWIEQHPNVDIKQIVYESYGITYTLIYSAITLNRKDIFEYLVACFYHDTINTIIESHGSTILHMVAEYDRSDWISFMIEQHGADPNFQDLNSGETPLIRALDTEYPDIALLDTVKQLIHYGTDVNITDNVGKTGLFYISENYDSCHNQQTLDIVKTIMDLLIDSGADMNIQDCLNHTVADHSFSHDYALKYFLDRNAPLNVSDERLKSIFLHHIKRGNDKFVALLLEKFPILKQTGKAAFERLRDTSYPHQDDDYDNDNDTGFQRTYDLLEQITY